ncbi:MAG: CCA tRNA nucleotidyltransferase [Clostridia bacterium]|nr:CCA tRNA nucleotidyltransferase [Clostridia bacterium]
MKHPTYIKNCIELLEQSGYSAYAVGGAVRDSLLGKEPFDWDVTTSAKPDEILSVFAEFRTIPTGIKHGTITVLFEENGARHPVEITTFRVDGEYRDSRHPESVSFSKNIQDDLSRRDFTVNAMAYNEKNGLVDIFGGQKDLENKIIRAVGDPETRFYEDALRILRAFRFSSQLEFEIEENTLIAAQKCAPLLKNIARERIFAEMKRLLASRGVAYSLKKMIEYNVWQEIFDICAPTSEQISLTERVSDGNFATRFAILLSNYSENERERTLNSLRPSNDEKRKVLRLCRLSSFPALDSNFPKTARHFLHLYDNILHDALEVLSAWTKNEDFASLKEAILNEQKQKRPLKISDLAVNGEDLLPLCVENRALVGKTLNLLLEKVIEAPGLNEKPILLEQAKEIIKNFK